MLALLVYNLRQKRVFFYKVSLLIHAAHFQKLKNDGMSFHMVYFHPMKIDGKLCILLFKNLKWGKIKANFFKF